MRWSRPVSIGASVPLAACSPIQSALAPRGPEAEDIAVLTWVLVAGAAGILFIVMIALGLALWGGPRSRAILAHVNAVRIGGIAFPLVTLTILLTYGLWLTRSHSAAGEQPALRIEVTGEQWWWRIGYLRADGTRVAEANEIRIPTGRQVEFVLTSGDVIHSFWVPSLGGKLDMIPGRTNRLTLMAQRPGIYRGQCAEYCGGPHALMALEVVAMPPEDFAVWLDAASAPRPEPSDATMRKGRDLFLASGCGACHAVRGTSSGTVGPDLSRVGGRRFLAAALLANDEAGLARFISNGQALKPGNQMPPFRIFSQPELAALAAYLASLK